MSWKSRIIRLHGLLKGRFRDWNDINISALVKNKALLTRQNQANLENFIKARNSSFFRRLLLFIRSGIYRQTLLGNLGLLLGITINKV
ncbi:hypothetical protein [Endozoicomonas sp.]|uniref:hypothetical protein n=1 Tax=Endozoicomonas sp. TaxID=1892382 RepID=UPI003AF425F2